jgi:hypothetical protein
MGDGFILCLLGEEEVLEMAGYDKKITKPKEVETV